MSTIKLPESVRDYLTDKAIGSVVEHLLSQDDKYLPPELEWEQLRHYHEAYLSAQKVKTDYALFVMDIWNIVWQPVLTKHADIIEGGWSIEDMREYEAEPTLAHIWDVGSYYRWHFFNKDGVQYNTNTYAVLNADTNSIYLLFRIDNDDTQFIPADEFDLKALTSWELIEIDGFEYITTPKKLIQIDSDVIEIDLTPLITMADDAMTKSIAYLQMRR